LSKEIIIIKEKWWASILKDVSTFTALSLMWVLNHKFLNASPAIDIIIAVFFVIVAMAAFSQRKSYTIEEAIEYLQKMAKWNNG
jgi:hypothetical protein